MIFLSLIVNHIAIRLIPLYLFAKVKVRKVIICISKMIHRFLFVCFDGRKGNSFLLNSYVLLTFFYQKKLSAIAFVRG